MGQLTDYMKQRKAAQNMMSGFQMQTQPGDPDFGLSTTPSSQAQFPAAAGEARLQDIQTRGQNRLNDAFMAGFDTSLPEFDPLQQAAEQGFVERALTLGERTLGWIDGPRQAVNLLIQDIAGGLPEEGMRNPNFGDYWNTLWGGVEDEDEFFSQTGLNPRSGSHTIDMFGWAPEDDFLGRAARGVVDFGYQILADPMTYVTFGLSGLGRKAAHGAARALQKESLDKIMPLLKQGITDRDLLIREGLTDYQVSLVQNLDEITETFGKTMQDFVEQNGGQFPAKVKRALNRYLGEGENPWANITELALANRIADDVMKPLIARNFKDINPLARQELPLWARGGARISVPFTQNTLRSGWELPGTKGVGRAVIGDPLRKVSEKLKGYSDTYRKMANRIDSAKNALDVERPLLEGLKLATKDGGIAGWQYQIAMQGIDTIHNQGSREIITAMLNSKFQVLRETTEKYGLDINEVKSLLMDRLEGADIGGVAARQAQDLFGPSAPYADVMDNWSALYPDLDRELSELSVFLRETFDEYHDKLGKLDPTVVDKYIKGYTPHKIAPEGRHIMQELALAGAAPPRKEWVNAQLNGDPGGGLFARLIAAISQGGRLETNMGASRYFNEREAGRGQAQTLIDDGLVLLDQEIGDIIRQGLPGTISDNIDLDALQTRYIPASGLNDLLRPVIEEQAKRHGIVLPRDWDGKVFSEDPFETAADYIGNVDEAIRVLSAMDNLTAAGLAMNHSVAVDVQDVLKNIMANLVKRTEKIRVAKFGTPDPDNHMVPVSWLKKIIDPMDWEAAKVRGTELTAEDLRTRGPIDLDADDPKKRGHVLKGAVFDASKPQGERLISHSVYGTREEFQESIRTRGVQVPLNVGVTPSGNVVLIDGHNRLLAADTAGIQEVPVRVTMLKDEDDLAAATGVNVNPYLKAEFRGKAGLAIPTPEEVEAGEAAKLAGRQAKMESQFATEVPLERLSDLLPEEALPKVDPASARIISEEFLNLRKLIAGEEDASQLLETRRGQLIPPEGAEDAGIPEGSFDNLLIMSALRRISNLYTGKQRVDTRFFRESELGSRLLSDFGNYLEGDFNVDTELFSLLDKLAANPELLLAGRWRALFREPEVATKLPTDRVFMGELQVGDWVVNPKGEPVQVVEFIQDAGNKPTVVFDNMEGLDAFNQTVVTKINTDKIKAAFDPNYQPKYEALPLNEIVDTATGMPVVPSTGRKTLAEVFDVLPWDPEPFTKEVNILRGSNKLVDDAVPFEIKGAVRRSRLGDPLKLQQAYKSVNVPIGEWMNRAVLKEAFTGDIPNVSKRVATRSMEVIFGEEGGPWQIKLNDGSLSEKRAGVEEVFKILDGHLSGKLNPETVENMLAFSGDATTARLFRRYLNRKFSSLPDNVTEWLASEPSELVQTRSLYEDWAEEINGFVNKYSMLQTSDGTLITDPKQLKLLGAGEIEEDLRRLHAAAEKVGDAGYDEAVKVMRNIEDYTSVADPNYVNPGLLALAGPAVDDMALQRHIALWMRNIARNSAYMYTPEGIAAAKIATNNSLRWWRGMATIARPSFHIRNLVGGSWMNMIHGVTNKNYGRVARNAPKLREALRSGKTLDEAFDTLPADARDMFRAAWENDVMSGFASTEFRRLTASEKRDRLAWAKVWDVDDFILSRMGGRVMESVEDFLRVSLFDKYYDPKNPGTAKIAKEMVNATHFDYVNLTSLETKLKSFIPFFVWTRRNIPRQLQLALENPRYVQRYRAMMQSMNDNFGGNDPLNMPEGDSFSAFAAGTDYFVNPNTPFWARVMIDPDLPIRDITQLPVPTIGNLADYANDMLGPHISTLVDLNEQREFGDVNAPAPLNAVLKSLAAVGLYDETLDGDVRIPYYMRSVLETALPFTRESIDPLTGGPSDPNRQQRLGISEEDGTLESIMKNIAGIGLSGLGIKTTTPADVRGVASRSNAELDALIEDLRLQGAFPASEG